MTILHKLASSLRRRDEVPNRLLAEEIVRTNNRSAVEELVDNVGNKNRHIQSDCIKVLYEISERKPALIVSFVEEFASLLESPNPRLTGVRRLRWIQSHARTREGSSISGPKFLPERKVAR